MTEENFEQVGFNITLATFTNWKSIFLEVYKRNLHDKILQIITEDSLQSFFPAIYTWLFWQFEDEEAEIPIGGTLPGGRKRLFSKELRCMMYGFGDDQNPYTESVDLLEDLVIEFITEMTHRAMEIGRTGRVQVEDIIFLGKIYTCIYSILK